MPLVNKAIAALNTIKTQDINELKVLGKPPTTIKKVLHAVCIMAARKPEKTPKPDNPKVFEENWWLTSTKFMSEKDFLKGLIEFDRDNIPNEIITKIRKLFINDPDFKPSRVKEASVAAEGLCLWVWALDEYDKVNKFVTPKWQKAREAESKYQVTMEGLWLKQNELKIVVQ